ncbi:hypothetical protein DQ238_14390 [Geodermatophilus sp. TF02-6]|uniref:hypothetical protein n=1 Tax=Geodermatophilus sp. TF02-6 TaxID=2250575 RepID=UPI000DE88F18|nr:hypothetical protein [Geodermatophilus sp. TF02-6]RBY77601.1 hypothetical protein DQ238_14390 [Geodermatophilus sp. TF02-6]
MSAGPDTVAVEADALAAAVAACPAVASLHAGGPRSTATYLPGRRVDGVYVSPDRVRVAVIAVHGLPMAAVAEQIREAVAPLAGDRPVDVHVHDLLLPDERPALPAGSSA